LASILLTLAWALAVLMAVCFLAAIAAIRFARQAPRGIGPVPVDGREPEDEVESESLLDWDQSPSDEAVVVREGVGAEGTPHVEEDLPARLADPDPFVRVDAITRLKTQPGGDLRILDALHDEFPIVRREAVRALREIGSPQAVTALVQVAGHDSSAEVREEAVAALGAIVRERNRGGLGDG
jgi:HEAT repeat protein